MSRTAVYFQTRDTEIFYNHKDTKFFCFLCVLVSLWFYNSSSLSCEKAISR